MASPTVTRKHTSTHQRTNKQQSLRISKASKEAIEGMAGSFEMPELLVLQGKETIDGRSRLAVRSLVYFASEYERNRCHAAASEFEITVHGHRLYGAEIVEYLD